MTTDRRTLLKGLAAVGLAFSGGALAQAATALPAGKTLAANATLPLTAVVSGSLPASPFLAGVTAAAQQHGMAQQPPLQLDGPDGALLNHIQALAQDAQPAMLVGLVDDATAAVLLDLVRSSGGRVLSERQQRLDGDASRLAALGQALVAAPEQVLPASHPQGRPCVSFCCVI